VDVAFEWAIGIVVNVQVGKKKMVLVKKIVLLQSNNSTQQYI
jgi:hypothetical protein